jgi:hypothetical protein
MDADWEWGVPGIQYHNEPASKCGSECLCDVHWFVLPPFIPHLLNLCVMNIAGTSIDVYGSYLPISELAYTNIEF